MTVILPEIRSPGTGLLSADFLQHEKDKHCLLRKNSKKPRPARARLVVILQVV